MGLFETDVTLTLKWILICTVLIFIAGGYFWHLCQKHVNKHKDLAFSIMYEELRRINPKFGLDFVIKYLDKSAIETKGNEARGRLEEAESLFTAKEDCD